MGRDLNNAKMHFCSKFGNCNFSWWWVMACTRSKWGKFWLWSSIWPSRSRSIIPQNGWWVIARTNSWLTDTRTHTHTYTHTQATTIPEGQNWPRVKVTEFCSGVNEPNHYILHANKHCFGEQVRYHFLTVTILLMAFKTEPISLVHICVFYITGCKIFTEQVVIEQPEPLIYLL